MRAITSWLFALLILANAALGQSAPTLRYTGSQISLQKGDINTDVLMGIIAKKQEEVKKKLFQDLVIKAFNNSKGAEKAFTTYQYLYSIISTITTEKNKTVATREIMQSLVQVAVVYGVTEYLRSQPVYKRIIDVFNAESIKANKAFYTAVSYKDTTGVAKSSVIDADDEEEEYDVAKKATAEPPSKKKEVLDSDDKDQYKSFNMILDIVYDLLIDQSKLRNHLNSQAIFSNSLKDPRFRIWYQSDNLFKVFTESNKTAYDSVALTNLRSNIDNFFDSAINQFRNSTIGKLMVDFAGDSKMYVSIEQRRLDMLQVILKNLINKLQVELKSRNLQLVSVITEFIQKYILIEEEEGALHIDLEALILAIDQKYNDPNKRPNAIPNWGYFSFFKPRLFLKMGVTRGQFYNDNLLSKDSAGKRIKLESIYYASEKLGLQFNVFNTGYTHAYKVGEPFYHRGQYKVWKRPQAQPLIYRGHIEIYGSGILYNLANLITEKDFNYMIIGINAGITFFNGLTLSTGYARPISVPYPGNNNFWNIAFDIPIVEYITALVKK